MDNLLDIRSAVQDDLTIDDQSTLFSPSLIDRVINRAYIKCATVYRWPQLEDAKTTSTQAGIETYDYPQGWRPNSLYRLEVDNIQYGEDPDGSPLNFSDYLIWRRDDANAVSAERKWANQQTRYFIYPVPVAVGLNNITIWGSKNVTSLIFDSDLTIFSYNMPECNEAILLETLAILKSKGENDNSSQFKSSEAKGILVIAYNKLRQEQSKYERNQPMFDVTDMFSNGRNRKIGNF
jgi:hypothetical protein